MCNVERNWQVSQRPLELDCALQVYRPPAWRSLDLCHSLFLWCCQSGVTPKPVGRREGHRPHLKGEVSCCPDGNGQDVSTTGQDNRTSRRRRLLRFA
jgi:hypothetical protein